MMIKCLSGPLRVSWRLASENEKLQSEIIKKAALELCSLNVNIVTLLLKDITYYQELPDLIKFFGEKVHIIVSTSNKNIEYNSIRKLNNAGLNALSLSLNIEEEYLIEEHINSLKNTINSINDLNMQINIVIPMNRVVLERIDQIISGLNNINIDKISVTLPSINKISFNPIELQVFFEHINKLEIGKPIVVQDPLASKITGIPYGPAFFPTCPAGRSLLHIEADGSVYPCTKLTKVCGNIQNDSIFNIWNNSIILNEIREFAASPECKNCSFYSSCLGGCKARLYEQGYDFSNIDPYCWISNDERSNYGSIIL